MQYAERRWNGVQEIGRGSRLGAAAASSAAASVRRRRGDRLPTRLQRLTATAIWRQLSVATSSSGRWTLYAALVSLSVPLAVAAESDSAVAAIQGTASPGVGSSKRDGEAGWIALVHDLNSDDVRVADNALDSTLELLNDADNHAALLRAGVGQALLRALEEEPAEAPRRLKTVRALADIVKQRSAHDTLLQLDVVPIILRVLERYGHVAPCCGGRRRSWLFGYGGEMKPVDPGKTDLALVEQCLRLLSSLALNEQWWPTFAGSQVGVTARTLQCAYRSFCRDGAEHSSGTSSSSPSSSLMREVQRYTVLCMAGLTRAPDFASKQHNFVDALLQAAASSDPVVRKYASGGLRNAARHVSLQRRLTDEEALQRLRDLIRLGTDAQVQTFAILAIHEMATQRASTSTGAPGRPLLDKRAAMRLEQRGVLEAMVDVLRESGTGAVDAGGPRDALAAEVPQRSACRAIASLCTLPGAVGEYLCKMLIFHGADQEILRVAESFEGADRLRRPGVPSMAAAALDAYAALAGAAGARVRLIARDASFIVRKLSECSLATAAATATATEAVGLPTSTCRSLLALIGRLSEDADALYMLGNQGLCGALYALLQSGAALVPMETEIVLHTVANLSRMDSAKLDLLGSRGALRLLLRLPRTWAQPGADTADNLFLSNVVLRRELARAVFNVSLGGLARVMASQADGVEAAVVLAADVDAAVRRYALRALSLFAEQLENTARIAKAGGVAVLATALAQRRTDPEAARAALLAAAELTNNFELHDPLIASGAGTWFAQYATQTSDIESQQYALAALCNLSTTPNGRAALRAQGVQRTLSGLAMSAMAPPELAMLANMVVANIVREEQNVMQAVPFTLPVPE
ncbi:hypothetical protein CDCA_CDCA02G0576 [Cyanidium caldarium]|uniref:Vacuolar protein 8 n=1 Tax=Cyanidium caldarium TaxID=2771 RepID=A0AAV9IR53_CYACA|nr:hypothetical protein CDCA_CDCA02G0576 [Cyanidium caldarium]